MLFAHRPPRHADAVFNAYLFNGLMAAAASLAAALFVSAASAPTRAAQPLAGATSASPSRC